jgi:hypothetical protein
MCILPIVARQRHGIQVRAATNTRKNRRNVGCVCLWVCLCILLSLLGNGSVNTFQRQRRIVGGIVFYAVRVLSKEGGRLVLPELLDNISPSALFYPFILHGQKFVIVSVITLLT